MELEENRGILARPKAQIKGHDAWLWWARYVELKMEIIETIQKDDPVACAYWIKQICYLGRSSWNMEDGVMNMADLSQTTR